MIRKYFFWILAIVTVVIGLYTLISPEFVLRWDAFNVHYIAWNFLSKALKQYGEIPLWNPNQYSGYPVFADPQTMLYYPIVFLMIITGHVDLQSMKFFVFMHFLLAGTGMYLYIKSLIKNQKTAMLLGMVYTLSGFLIAHTTHLGILVSYTWLPVLWLCVRRSLRKESVLHALMGTLIAANIILAGHAQSILIIFAYTVLYIGYEIWKKRKQREQWLKVAFIAALFIGLACLFSAIQLLPTQEFASLSMRSEISLERVQTESLEFGSLLTFILPNFFDAIFQKNYWGPWSMTEHYLFIGTIPFTLSALSLLLVKNKKTVRFFVAITVFSALFALGKWSFVQTTLYHFVPFFDKFRASAHTAGIMSFGLIVLSGYGLEFLIHWLREKTQQKEKILKKIIRIGSWGSFVIIVQVIIGMLIARGIKDDVVSYKWLFGNLFAGIVIGVLILGIALYFIYQTLNKKTSIQGLRGVLFVLVAMELLTFTVHNKLITVEERVELKEAATPVQEFLTEKDIMRNERVYTKDPLALMPQTSIPLTDGYNPLVLQNYAEFYQLHRIHEDYFNPMVRLLNIEYAYSNEEDKTFFWEHEKHNIRRNPAQGSFGWFADELKFFEQGEIRDKIDTMTKSDFTKVAWIDKDYRLSEEEFEGNNSVELLEYSPNELQFKVNMEQSGFLVLSEIFYPGWNAYINGEQIEVYETNVAFRGMYFEAGEYDIVMKFEPKSLALGKKITFLALCIWFFFFGREILVKRKKG